MVARFELVVACAFLVLILLGVQQTYRIDLAFSSDLETFSGPRAYPGLILGLMLVANLGVIASLLFSRQPVERSDEPLFTRGTVDAAIVLLALVVFVFTFEPLGYLVAMIPLLIVSSMMNGARNLLVAAIVSTLMALACLVIFRYVLNTVLPEGVLGIDMIL